MKFARAEVVEALLLDELNGGDQVELVISGLLSDGSAFVTEGDCIVIVP